MIGYIPGMLFEKYDKVGRVNVPESLDSLKCAAAFGILSFTLIWSLVWASANAHHLHDARSGPDRDAPDCAVSG